MAKHTFGPPGTAPVTYLCAIPDAELSCSNRERAASLDGRLMANSLSSDALAAVGSQRAQRPHAARKLFT